MPSASWPADWVAVDGTVTSRVCGQLCEQGLASWARLTTIAVDAGLCPGFGVGYACVNFGIVRIPQEVGFRLRYSPQGSAIAGGTSTAKDFTWTE